MRFQATTSPDISSAADNETEKITIINKVMIVIDKYPFSFLIFKYLLVFFSLFIFKLRKAGREKIGQMCQLCLVYLSVGKDVCLIKEKLPGQIN